MDISEQKAILRNKLLEKRENLSEAERRQASEKIVKRLTQQPEFQQAEIIHCYVSISSRNEVNTLFLIQEMLQGNKRVVAPITNFDSGKLSHIILHSFDDLKPNKWGVLEPEPGTEVDSPALDLIIVPMVGGDPQGNRLGYGKGFYDRFLAEVECPAIGLCFEKCMVKAIPVEKFDICLSRIITEKRVL